LCAMTTEELARETVLFEQKARCRKYDRSVENNWDNKGVGPIRILKNKESGNLRVVMRLDPSGALLINHNVMNDRKMYERQGEKQVKMVFAEQDGLATFLIQFGKAEKATEIVKLLTES